MPFTKYNEDDKEIMEERLRYKKEEAIRERKKEETGEEKFSRDVFCKPFLQKAAK